ncbi:DegV family protein [Alloiococcus sp. CFN-8]|uniref:DegV family protein n=1 Tax=Alloiococcus sp. CFN-8 TaxID=3416081 RepID=UPI003CFB8B5C
MKDYILMTDSCCDLPREYIEEKNVPFVSLTCRFKDREYKDDFGVSLKHKEFYKGMEEGEVPKTSQPSPDEFYSAFKKYAEEGKDIIYVCVSSGLSGTYNSANIAKGMIQDENPDVNIEIVDILTASLGQGFMVMEAIKLKEEGATFQEVKSFLEESKWKLNTFITVDDLIHLKRGGRISSTAAFLGGLMSLKPIIAINNQGKVDVIQKARGRKSALKDLAKYIINNIENPETTTMYIGHCDAIEDAQKLKEIILEKINLKEVVINFIGPVVGVYGGPGALAAFFVGKPRYAAS